MKREIFCTGCNALLVTITDEGMKPAAEISMNVGPVKPDGTRDTELVCPKCNALTPYDIETPPALH